MKLTKDKCFWIDDSNPASVKLGFTVDGLRSFGSLFVCEPLVKKTTTINSKTKLFAVEGMLKLSCIRSPFTSAKIESLASFSDPCEITKDTPLASFKEVNINALSVM